MKKIFAAALSLLISSSVFSGHHEDLNIKEIKTTYQAYVDDFINKDFEAIANHFQAPMMQRTEEGMIVSDTPADISQRYRNYMENIQDGYKYSTVNRLDVTRLSSSLYYADADYSRFNSKNELLHHGRSIYFFSNADGGWKIFSMEEVERK